MISINFIQNHPFRIEESNKRKTIFDDIRKKWVVLSPEEWVRQNIIQYMLQTKKYPHSMIAIEKSMPNYLLSHTSPTSMKRVDIVVFKHTQPWLLIECKKATCPISQNTFLQALSYYQQWKIRYIILTNGVNTMGWDIQQSPPQTLYTFPDYI